MTERSGQPALPPSLHYLFPAASCFPEFVTFSLATFSPFLHDLLMLFASLQRKADFLNYLYLLV